jgi:Arc/MetJ-type ribon-helix-helix transcriptional regulator
MECPLMNISLKPEVEKRVAEKVSSGEYSSPEAVVEEAVEAFLEWDARELDEAWEGVERALEQSKRGEGMSLEEFDRVRMLPEASDDAQKLYWRLSSQAPFYVQQWYNGLFAARLIRCASIQHVALRRPTHDIVPRVCASFSTEEDLTRIAFFSKSLKMNRPSRF